MRCTICHETKQSEKILSLYIQLASKDEQVRERNKVIDRQRTNMTELHFQIETLTNKLKQRLTLLTERNKL